MSRIKIITDASATLPKNIIKENDIGVVDLKIIWPEENVDGDLFKKMRNTLTDTSPKTSQPSVGDFKKAFENAFKTYDEIICITISTGLSGTYNSAMQAIKFLPKEKQSNVAIIDSFTVDAGQGFIVLRALELAKKGLDFKEIVSKLENFKNGINIVGFAGDSKWLEINGRLSRTGANIIRQMEKVGIRPLLTVKNGKVAVTSIKFKAKDKTESILRELKERIKNKKAVLAITHGDAILVAEDLKQKLTKECPNIKVLFIDEINPVIGCHLGPDGIICSYYLKENDVI